METDQYLLGEPKVTACFRRYCEDFVVDELLGFEPDGAGEHCALQIRKINANTAFVARQIARAFAVRERDVSFSGLKDRRAIASQWFSVYLPGKPDLPVSGLESDEIQVLQRTRHSRKLRRGTHTGNRFRITLRDVDGDVESVDTRLAAIRDAGFPNYFGEQRFGHAGQNVERARLMFSKPLARKKKRDTASSLYISAARSALFNRVLSARLVAGHYEKILPGDVMMLDGTRSLFPVERPDKELEQRYRSGDIHITGPLWGCGSTLTSPERHAWEASCLLGDEDLGDGLAEQGLKHERRALRAVPRELSWQWTGERDLQISFCLDSGAYATSLLREVAVLNSSCQDARPQQRRDT